MYFIHPFVIFEVSISKLSILMYVFSSIIFNSYSVRTKCFNTSREVRTCSSDIRFSVLLDREECMILSIVSRVMCSMCE